MYNICRNIIIIVSINTISYNIYCYNNKHFNHKNHFNYSKMFVK